MRRIKLVQIIRILIVLILCGVLLSGCRTKAEPISSAPEEEIAYHLPVLLPITGEIEELGEDAKWAAVYAVEKINASGGINGVPVRLDIYDNESNEKEAKNLMKQLTKVERFVIGPIDSTTTTAVADIVLQTKTPNIAAYSYESVRTASAPYGISYMSDTMEGEFASIAMWKKDNPDIGKVAVLVSKGETSQLETAELLKSRLSELSMSVCNVIEIDANENNGLEAVVEALNSKADGYIVLARASDYQLIISELRNRGIDEGRRFTASFASFDQNVAKANMETIKDTYIWNKFDANYGGQAWQDLAAEYADDHNGIRPDNIIVPEIYNAVFAWKTCIEDLGLGPKPVDLDREKKEMTEWFYDSKELNGIQGDYHWIDGNKKSAVYFFQFNEKGEAVSVSNQ